MTDIFAGIEKKETARKAATAPIAAAQKAAAAGGAAAAGTGEKYEGTAAVTRGSTEAASALAKFFNRSTADAAGKETAANTKQLVEMEKKRAEDQNRLFAMLAGGAGETAVAVAAL